MKYQITDMTIRIEGKRREPGEVVEMSEADSVRLARYLIAVPEEVVQATPQAELPMSTTETPIVDAETEQKSKNKRSK